MTTPSNDPSRKPDPADAEARPGGALIERPNYLPNTALYHEPLHIGAEEESIKLREYWDIIVKRKWAVLTFFAITVIAVMTATFITTRIYRATLTLQIEQQDTKAMALPGALANEQFVFESPEFLQTQYELLKSDTLAQRVIEQLNLVAAPQPEQKSPGWLDTLLGDNARKTENPEPEAGNGLMSGLPGELSVVPVRNSRLVRINFDSPDPQLAARIANTIAVAFINLNLERRMEATSYARTFLEERLQQIKVKLEDSEKQLNAFTRREGIVKPDEKQQSPETQVLGEFTSALAKAQSERIRAETLYQQARGGDAASAAAVVDNALVQEYKTRKSKLEGDYQEGLKTYKPGYPKMQQIESQIDELQAKINQEIKATIGALKANYDAALAQENLLAAKLKESKQTVLGGQDSNFQYNLLKREVDTNRQLYDSLLQRYKEIGVAGGVGTNNVTVVDKAKVPGFPFKPRLTVNLMIALFIGLAGGIALALLLEHLDDTIKLPDDMEKFLGLPVLGIIPATKRADNAELALAENADQRSAFAEAYRSLRTALQFATPEGMPKVLLLTSTTVGEGKSTCALSLAMHIAQTGKTVLLIDSDLRKASLHTKLGIVNDSGLTNYLAGNAQPVDITRQTEIPRLFLMSSGPLPPNPAELISSVKMVALLKLATEKFDQVIIDGPPVLGLADAPLLGSLAEATVLVVGYGTTSRQFAQTSVKRLRGTRTRLIGGILNRVSSGHRSYGYNSYYYQYGEPDQKQLSA